MNCNLCKNSDVAYFLSAVNMHGNKVWDANEHFAYVKCTICGAVSLSDLSIDDSYYSKYYPALYYNMNGAPGFFDYLSRLISFVSLKHKERLLLNYVKKTIGKINILDIGCGEGDFLSRLDSKKFNKHGIEINQIGCDECSRKGVAVHGGTIETSNFKKRSFDVITFWHVLEHLNDPLGLIRVAKDYLKENGILIISTPNIESLGFRLAKESWFHLDAPRHLTLFSQSSLKFLADSAGFDIIGSGATFYEYPLDLFWNAKLSNFKIPIYLFYPILKIYDKETMMLIMKKNG